MSKCTEGNGFVNLINDELILYVDYLGGKGTYDKNVAVYAENSFKKPQNCLNYSLYYFECKINGELANFEKIWIFIGLKNLNTKKYILYSAKDSITNEEDETFKIENISLNNNDIFGCGLVYPPSNMSNKFPYIFFTQNGKQIGKGVLLKDNSDLYKPFVELKCCSVKANFGNDLELKPFKYDISKHLILEEFY
ncbi:unnamed protein product [Meloidogyne enterolobii]